MGELPFLTELGDRFDALAELEQRPVRHGLRARGSRAWRRVACWVAGTIALAGGGTAVLASVDSRPQVGASGAACVVRCPDADERSRRAPRPAAAHRTAPLVHAAT